MQNATTGMAISEAELENLNDTAYDFAAIELDGPELWANFAADYGCCTDLDEQWSDRMPVGVKVFSKIYDQYLVVVGDGGPEQEWRTETAFTERGHIVEGRGYLEGRARWGFIVSRASYE